MKRVCRIESGFKWICGGWLILYRPRWIEPPRHFTLQTKIKISKIKFGGLVNDFTSHGNWSVILALATLAGDLGKPTAQVASDDRIRERKRKKKVKIRKRRRKTKKIKKFLLLIGSPRSLEVQLRFAHRFLPF